MSITLTADRPAFEANSLGYTTADVDHRAIVVFQCASCLRCLGDSSSSPAEPRQEQGRRTDDDHAPQDNRPDQAGDRQPRSVTTAGNQHDAAVVTLSKVSDNVVLIAEEMITLSGSTYRYLKCECGKRIGRAYWDDPASSDPASAKVVVANRFCLDKKQLTEYQTGSVCLIPELETRNSIRGVFEKLEQMMVAFHQRQEAFDNRLSDITSVLENERLAQAPGSPPKESMTDKRESKQTPHNVGNKRAGGSSKEANSRSMKSPKKRRYEYLTNTESGSESGSEY